MIIKKIQKLFSERQGIVPEKLLQTDNLDHNARMTIFNFLLPLIYVSNRGLDERLWRWIGEDFFYMASYNIFEVEDYGEFCLSSPMEEKYRSLFKGDWYRIFDFVEFLHGKSPNLLPVDQLNSRLEREKVGYRFVDGQFVPLTNEVEMKAVGQAATSPHEHVRNHVKKAIAMFADRQNPDYRNSIKESISAVESLACEITGENDFNKAIGALERKGVKMHPQFAAAAKNLYNFTSDEEGIRHAAKGEPLQCDQPTAQFMLVVCSAFVNHIAAAAATARP